MPACGWSASAFLISSKRCGWHSKTSSKYETKLDKWRCLDDSLQKSTPDLNQDANVGVPAGNFCQGFISFTEGELILIYLI